MKINVTTIVRHLDSCGGASPCVWGSSGLPVDPRELWIMGLGIWLRQDCSSASSDVRHNFKRWKFGPISRMRLRLALRRLAAR